MDYELEREVTNELDDVTSKGTFGSYVEKLHAGFCFPQNAEICQTLLQIRLTFESDTTGAHDFYNIITSTLKCQPHVLSILIMKSIYYEVICIVYSTVVECHIYVHCARHKINISLTVPIKSNPYFLYMQNGVSTFQPCSREQYEVSGFCLLL